MRFFICFTHVYVLFHKKCGRQTYPTLFPPTKQVKKEYLRTVSLNWDENDNTSHEKSCIITFFSQENTY